MTGNEVEVEEAVMGDTLVTSVTCANCGTFLKEGENVPYSQRTPCPTCRGLNRKLHLIATTEVQILSSVNTLGVRAGLSKAKGWFKRTQLKEAFQRNLNHALVDVCRIFDRENDRYKETVTVRKSGEIIHAVDEKLSEHRGHGSDRKR